MSSKDEILAKQLDALVEGSDLESVLASLPAEEQELASLVQLAAAIRNLPHPEPLTNQAFESKTRPRNAIRENAVLQSRPSFLDRLREQFAILTKAPKWALAPAILGLMMVFFFAASAVLGLGIYFSGPRSARMATLMDVNGQIQVASTDDPSVWRTVENGDKVHTGDRIRSAGASSATLVFFDGSRAQISSNSDVTLKRVDGDWGNVLRVVMVQNQGKTDHSVVPLKGKTSSYMVFTPAGAASVHGTTFQVAVDPQGKSRFAVNTGKVLVSNDLSETFLEAGKATTVESGEAINEGDYQFTLQGELTSSQGSTWIVSGVPFTVLTDTLVTGDPQVGNIVLVEGRVLDSGEWVADSVERVYSGSAEATFTGELQSMDGEVWLIGGWSVVVDQGTEKSEGLEEGMPVRVNITLLEDGRWRATSIQALTNTDEEPTPEPSATPDPNAMPSLSFEPDELEMAVCPANGSAEYNLTGTLHNEGEDENDVAANVELSYQITKGAEFVDMVELDPMSWESIPAGEVETFNIHVVLSSEGWANEDDDHEVELRIFIANETNRPDDQTARLTVNLESNCEDLETEEPEVTETISPTETVSPTVTVTPEITDTISTAPEATEEFVCTGAQPHPTGMTLAERYGVPYEEIMGWFCQGFGFGEIDLAYSLSLQSGTPVEQIFQMKMDGMGWGNIKKELAPKPAKPTKAPKPPKPPKGNGNNK
ncbi:MAG: DUF5666 domain-containing protein [Anaerolineales bacterium]